MKSPSIEPTRTKEKRQAQEYMEKRSGAGDEGGTSHMGHNGDNNLNAGNHLNAGNSLATYAPLQEQERHKSSKSSHSLVTTLRGAHCDRPCRDVVGWLVNRS